MLLQFRLLVLPGQYLCPTGDLGFSIDWTTGLVIDVDDGSIVKRFGTDIGWYLAEVAGGKCAERDLVRQLSGTLLANLVFHGFSDIFWLFIN